MDDKRHGTLGGAELSDELLHQLADEAEAGYGPERIRTRSRRGRPPIGEEAAHVFHVRLPPALRRRLEEAADHLCSASFLLTV